MSIHIPPDPRDPESRSGQRPSAHLKGRPPLTKSASTQKITEAVEYTIANLPSHVYEDHEFMRHMAVLWDAAVATGGTQ